MWCRPGPRPEAAGQGVDKAPASRLEPTTTAGTSSRSRSNTPSNSGALRSIRGAWARRASTVLSSPASSLPHGGRLTDTPCTYPEVDAASPGSPPRADGPAQHRARADRRPRPDGDATGAMPWRADSRVRNWPARRSRRTSRSRDHLVGRGGSVPTFPWAQGTQAGSCGAFGSTPACGRGTSRVPRRSSPTGASSAHQSRTNSPRESSSSR